MTSRKEVLMAMDDVTLNKTVKIARTEHDRRRVLNDKQVSRARHLISIGVTWKEAAKIFDVDPRTIRSYTDENYRIHTNKMTNLWRYHNNISYDRKEYAKNYLTRLAAYKRALIANDLITA